MAFETYETSRQQGAPTETFLFRWGVEPGSYFAYTSHSEEITLEDGITYTPIAIKRETPLQNSGTLDKAQMKLRAQHDIPLRNLFIVWPPSSVVNLTIRQGHFDDPDSEFLVCFTGRVMSFEREESDAVMTADPISTSMRTPNLRRYYQYGCPFLLYGPDCRADRAARTITVTVVDLEPDEHRIIMASGWSGALSTGKYKRGEVRWTDTYGETQIRQILATGTAAVLVSGPLIDLNIGDSIDLSAGCNHLTTAVNPAGDCVTLHENGPNYGGQPWIPLKNPVGIRNGFY